MKSQNSAVNAAEDFHRMKIDPWRAYEAEKAKLRQEDLPCDEYARRLRKIADRLSV